MTIKADSRFSARKDASVFKRVGSVNQINIRRNNQANNVICKYWLQGRCSRNPCKFLHPNSTIPKPKQSHTICKTDGPEKSSYTWKNPVVRNSKKSPPVQKALQNDLKSEAFVSQIQSIPKTPKLCSYWAANKCEKGDKCENLHSWSYGKGLSMMAKLEGQSKAVTGIVLPSGSDKLYCGSKDKSLRVWDCNTGQCVAVVDMGVECETLVNEDPWIFAGLTGTIKAWNLQTKSELTLHAPGGKVNAITMFNDLVFAGMKDGTILVWKCTSETSFFELPESLKGHTGAVLSLVVGAEKLFSGSADHSIRVWNPESLHCMHVLNGHIDGVTTVLCWDSYLLSGSLDKKIKCWAATENGKIVEVQEHNVDDGILAFCGVHDAENKPILLCSCTDNTVRLYDLPSFTERGRIFSRQEIQAIQIGPGGLFFTGDTTGLVSVWKLHQDPV